MSWVGFGLLAGVILGLYDFWTKKAMFENMVLAVVFWSALFGALAWMIAFLPISAGTEFHVPVSETNFREQLLILAKGIMMTGSWVFAYYSVRELPMSFSGAMRASGPLWTMLGGAIVFQEFLTPIQFAVVAVAVVGYLMLAQIGRTEGISLIRSAPLCMMLLATILSAMTTVYDKFIVHELNITATKVQAWSAVHRFFLSGILLVWACRYQPAGWKVSWSIWIPLVGLSWVGAEWVYFLAINDSSANVTYLSVFRRSSLIVGFLLSVMLIGEQNVKQKSVVVAILFLSTVILAFQS
jgi:transporter family protein